MYRLANAGVMITWYLGRRFHLKSAYYFSVSVTVDTATCSPGSNLHVEEQQGVVILSSVAVGKAKWM
jgi:hypothetical protein